jgi:transposase-like protein
VPITEANPFKGRQYPGQLIVTAVPWYLRHPLAYEHASELRTERGLPVDGSRIWRWVQAYAPELSKRCRQHLEGALQDFNEAIRLKPGDADAFYNRGIVRSAQSD